MACRRGPALVLVMGYRLNSPLGRRLHRNTARQFTVITLDNRGTGLSDKPSRLCHCEYPDNMSTVFPPCLRDVVELAMRVVCTTPHCLQHMLDSRRPWRARKSQPA